MNDLYYVVDTITGQRFEPGHLELCDALLAMADKYADLPNIDSPGRYVIESGQPDSPAAYAVHGQCVRD